MRTNPNQDSPNPAKRWFQVSLTEGKIALVDEEDFDFVSQFKWHFDGHYARRSVKVGVNQWKHQRMHTLIVGAAPIGLQTDHISGDKLDNRRSNLRFITRAHNGVNSKLRKDNSSGAKGVYRVGLNRWTAQVRINGKSCQIGSFPSRDLAVEARQRKAIELYGEFYNTSTRKSDQHATK
jgi:hypothetical protein